MSGLPDRPDVVALRLEPDGRIHEVLVDVFDRSAGATSLVELLDPRSRDKAVAMLDELAGGGNVAGRELVVSPTADAPGGELRWLAWHDGDHFLVVGSTSPEPVTGLMELNNELATAQRSLAKQNVVLERLNEEKDQLLGTVAHDLRNPLTAITGLAEAVASGRAGGIDDDARRLVARIAQIGRNMASLVDDLVDLSAVASGRVNLALEDVAVAEVVDDAVELVGFDAADKDITIEVAVPAGLTVRADRGKLHQIVQNLVDNAVKYSPAGAAVHVAVEREDDRLRLVVADEGVGIPADELGKLFQPFGTTSASTTAGEPSTGLGLAIVQRLVAAHGGEVDVDSEEGVGSTFEVWLPLAGPQVTDDRTER